MDKIDKLLDAIDNPDGYSVEEIEEMLEDQEVKEFYSLLSKTNVSMGKGTPLDIDAEWESLMASAKRKEGFTSFLKRNAAAVIIVAVSLVSVAAVVCVNGLIKTEREGFPNLTAMPVPESADTVAEAVGENHKGDAEPENVVVFKDETLERILTVISEYYNVDINFENDEKRSLRLYFKWDRRENLHDVCEALDGFEQLSVSESDGTLTIR